FYPATEPASQKSRVVDTQLKRQCRRISLAHLRIAGGLTKFGDTATPTDDDILDYLAVRLAMVINAVAIVQQPSTGTAQGVVRFAVLVARPLPFSVSRQHATRAESAAERSIERTSLPPTRSCSTGVQPDGV
ncbi:hypothetical protein, partial [Actinoplanes cyaneus]